jgi:cyclic beta-1,2-glucan synthetase
LAHDVRGLPPLLAQVREIPCDLPSKHHIELPKLTDGPLGGYPRVYMLAPEPIAHTAGRLDLDTPAEFTTAFSG